MINAGLVVGKPNAGVDTKLTTAGATKVRHCRLYCSAETPDTIAVAVVPQGGGEVATPGIIPDGTPIAEYKPEQVQEYVALPPNAMLIVKSGSGGVNFTLTWMEVA